MTYHENITVNSAVSLLSWSSQGEKGEGADGERPNAYKRIMCDDVDKVAG